MSPGWEKRGLLFTPEEGPEWMRSHAAVPVARHLEGGVHRIFFATRNRANESQIGFVEIDLDHPDRPKRVSRRPVLTCGPPGNFDDSGVMPTWIVRRSGIDYLYYVGWNRSDKVPFRNALGLAVSSDGGRTFERYSAGPILDRSIHDPCLTASCSVRVEDGLWRMWYLSGLKWEVRKEGVRHYYHIKYAESDDGVNWRREGRVCIDFANDREYAISRPCVLADRNGYRMWYSFRGAQYRIGYAESKDGLVWDRRDREAGIDVSDTGWDSTMIEYPFVFDHGGRRILLYNGDDYGRTGIGWASLW